MSWARFSSRYAPDAGDLLFAGERINELPFETLMARGLDPKQAVDLIIKGMLS